MSALPGATEMYAYANKVVANSKAFVRRSTDSGSTWGPRTEMTTSAGDADATSGASYKTAAGFGFPYGDYDMVAINSLGKHVVAMGEGDSTQTYGDIWVNSKPQGAHVILHLVTLASSRTAARALRAGMRLSRFRSRFEQEPFL